jgi:DNA adenine methylase
MAPRGLVRHVGGKTDLAEFLAQLLPEGGTYWEPFVGGGSVAYQVAQVHSSRSIVLSDIGPIADLHDAAIRYGDRLAVAYEGRYRHLPATRDTFVTERERWNRGRQDAVRQLYLRRNGFNGLWRERADGGINQDWCKEELRDPDAELLASWRACFAGRTTVMRCRYDEIEPQRGDVVYLDPPYLGTWTGYSARGWTRADWRRLVSLCRVWSAQGVRVALSHVLTDDIEQSLRLWRPRILEVSVRRRVSCDGARPLASEIVACSW